MPVQTTDIGWCDLSANHWVGCAKVSEGCMNCWSADMAHRFDRTPEPWTVEHIDANLTVYDEDIYELLHRYPANDPAWCFFPSSSDPFLPWLDASTKWDYIEAIEGNTHLCFQVLTKWGPENDRAEQEAYPDEYEPTAADYAWDDHVMLGVTVETELRTYRLDWLREQSAATKFVSFEPLLERIDEPDLSGIDWAIIGGESGPNRRPFEADWARDLITECSRQGVAPFFKQHGDRFPEERTQIRMGDWIGEIRHFPELPDGVLGEPQKYQVA